MRLVKLSNIASCGELDNNDFFCFTDKTDTVHRHQDVYAETELPQITMPFIYHIYKNKIRKICVNNSTVCYMYIGRIALIAH